MAVQWLVPDQIHVDNTGTGIRKKVEFYKRRRGKESSMVGGGVEHKEVE